LLSEAETSFLLEVERGREAFLFILKIPLPPLLPHSRVGEGSWCVSAHLPRRRQLVLEEREGALGTMEKQSWKSE